MPIELKLTADTVEELENLIGCLQGPQIQTRGLREIVDKEVADQNRAAAASPAPAKPRAPRAKKAEPAPEPAAPVVDANIFPVFKATGEKFSDFRTADNALARLKQEAIACADLDALNNLTANNMETVERFPAELQDAYQEAIDDRYNDLTPGEDDGELEPATLQEVEVAVKDFVRTKGLIKAKEVFASLGVTGVPAMKPEQYPVLIQKLKAAA